MCTQNISCIPIPKAEEHTYIQCQQHCKMQKIPPSTFYMVFAPLLIYRDSDEIEHRHLVRVRVVFQYT
jgi:hypothetical protein